LGTCGYTSDDAHEREEEEKVMSIGYGMHPGKEHYVSDEERHQRRKEREVKKHRAEIMRVLGKQWGKHAMAPVAPVAPVVKGN
jgi:hypothetical protein